MLLALFWFHDGVGASRENIFIAHFCDCRRCIKASLDFHLAADVLHHFLFVLVELQGCIYQMVAFEELSGCESYRNLRSLGMVLDKAHHGMDCPVYSSSVFFRVAEILADWPLIVFCHMQGVVYQLCDALVLKCGNRNHRNGQSLLQNIH